jgi:hypothetical protein
VAAAQTGAAFATAGQLCPQPPQLPTFDVTSTQLPPQLVVVPGQSVVQTPSAHTSGEVGSLTLQALVQLPQCAPSLISSMHTMPFPVSQATRPALQITPQTPFVQVASEPVGEGHACPQAPQFDTSLVPSTQRVPHLSAPPVH